MAEPRENDELPPWIVGWPRYPKKKKKKTEVEKPERCDKPVRPSLN